MSTKGLRTIEIPRSPAPDKRRRAGGDAYPCVVCGIAVTKPKFTCHLVDGGSTALHRDDEDRYEPDGGDVGHYPIGTDCLRRHPEMKDYVHKVPEASGG